MLWKDSVHCPMNPSSIRERKKEIIPTAGGEGNDRRWRAWMASPTWWTWVWASSRSWWWTGRPGVLKSMGSQSQTRLSDWTELNSHSRKAYEIEEKVNIRRKSKYLAKILWWCWKQNYPVCLFSVLVCNSSTFVSCLFVCLFLLKTAQEWPELLMPHTSDFISTFDGVHSVQEPSCTCSREPIVSFLLSSCAVTTQW